MAMAKFYQYFNRTLVTSDDRMDDRAFAFGDGFFSTIGVHQGQILFAQLHHNRIMHGLTVFKLNLDVDEMMICLSELAHQMTEGIIKIIITRPRQSMRGYGFLAAQPAQVLIKVMSSAIYQGVSFIKGIPIQPTMPRQMVCLTHKLSHRPPHLAGIKLIGATEQVFAHAELLHRQRADDSILDGLVGNVHGEWICATMGNVFYRLGQDWYTPLVDKSGVLGVMRRAVIQSDLLGDVKERVLSDADLDLIDGLITTNAVRGMTAMSMLNGRKLAHTFG
ncbi:aminotransferase class IV [Moraxella catarrhalis]|uniref:aminotransferase class IV n=1 Tax=Moraxella catarrhalis TaxID=480 RepID=UPI0008033F25|nr:aminotransferase class IV [Moraxella catarrhalis]MPW63456.1 aminodeoxychorismate lyase [Moraxella catarrhalis]OBX44329.1 aminodeoxychorismate lyase [Moraxella catarrhalis]